MLGAAAAALRSDLEIPEQIAKFLSLYLLFAIGFKGGVALAESPLDAQVVASLGAALLSGPQGKLEIGTFVDDMFIGVLCLFLLDMGIVAMRRLLDLRGDFASIKPLSLAA